MLQENRKFIRFDIHLNLELSPNGPKGGHLVGITRNFSRDGFSFVSEYFDYDASKTIEFKMEHPQSENYVSVLGNIVWRRQVRDRCLAGIRIVGMEEEVKSEILDYAYDRWIESMRYRQDKSDK